MTDSPFGDRVDPVFPEPPVESPGPQKTYTFLYIFNGNRQMKEVAGEAMRDSAIAQLAEAGITEYDMTETST